MIDDEYACARLISRLAYFADAERPADYASLFTDDGELVGRHAAKGRDAIQKVMESRPASRHTRHLLTPPLLEFTDNDNATGLTYATVYVAVEEDRDEAGLLPAHSPVVAELRTSLRRTPGGWRVCRHGINVVLAPPR